jgi:hypothetical protein
MLRSKKVTKIRLSELKRIIRSEVRRAKLNEQRGRGRPSEAGGEIYTADEFLDYLKFGKKGGRGRPFEYHVDINGTLYTVSDKELIDAYDVDGTWVDVYDAQDAFLAKFPVDINLLEVVE